MVSPSSTVAASSSGGGVYEAQASLVLPVNSVTFNGLDSDRSYKLYGRVKQAVGAGGTFQVLEVLVNGVGNWANIGGYLFVHGSLPVSVAANALMPLSVGGTNGVTNVDFELTFHCPASPAGTGFERVMHSIAYVETPGDATKNKVFLSGGTWDNTVTDITSLTINVSNGGQIDAGSWFGLQAIGDVT